jgi:membrane associated rhomboid family serine protease
MGIYNRDYYRESPPRGNLVFESFTPVVKWLIIANVTVFLGQIFFVRNVPYSPLEAMRKHNPELDKLLADRDNGDAEADKKLKKKYPGIDKLVTQSDEDLAGMPEQRTSILQEWFELDTAKVLGGQVWRLITHAVCHDRYSIWHIVFNMLLLYWFGCTLEAMYGSREFLLFYLVAAVAGAAAFVGLDLYTGSRIPAIGASGAVMGVMMCYTVLFPRQIIYVCWVIPIEMRWLMALYVIWDVHPVLLALSGDQVFGGIAHAAHLGGVAFGFFYARQHWRLEPVLDSAVLRICWLRLRLRNRHGLRIAPHSMPRHERDVDMERIDELLQKITDSGKASLTEEECALLRKASECIRSRSNGGS